MAGASGRHYLVANGVLTALAGLELRSGSGLLRKRKPGGPVRSGLGVGLILMGILVITVGVVLRVSL